MIGAVYAGSFDPPTNGHLWMIEQASKMFNKVWVIISSNPAKRPMFTDQERIDMLHDICSPFANVQVKLLSDVFVVDAADFLGARYLVRGIRNQTDFEYESAMRHVNEHINHKVQTVFLMPPKPLSEVSSSMVKGLIGFDGWDVVVKDFVPNYVYRVLFDKKRPT